MRTDNFNGSHIPLQTRLLRVCKIRDFGVFGDMGIGTLDKDLTVIYLLFSIFLATIFKFEENKDQFLIYLDYLG